jgi:mRNA interferase YafQ
MLRIEITGKFKKDVRLAKRRGLDIGKLDAVINALRSNEVLPEEYRNHKLSGDYHGHSECHIEPDWLIYRLSSDGLVLTAVRTGTHSDLSL